jgi:hypothetical protein
MDNDKTTWLFIKPLQSDWAFWLWIGISALASLSGVIANSSTGLEIASSGAGLVSGTIDAIVSIISNLVIFYVISLVWLIPRGMIFKKRLADLGQLSDVSSTPVNDTEAGQVESATVSGNLQDIDSKIESKQKLTNSKMIGRIVGVALGIALVISLAFNFRNTSGSNEVLVELSPTPSQSSTVSPYALAMNAWTPPAGYNKWLNFNTEIKPTDTPIAFKWNEGSYSCDQYSRCFIVFVVAYSECKDFEVTMKVADSDGLLLGYISGKLITLPQDEPAKIEIESPYGSNSTGNIYSMTCSNDFTGAS